MSLLILSFLNIFRNFLLGGDQIIKNERGMVNPHFISYRIHNIDVNGIFFLIFFDRKIDSVFK